MPRKRTVLKPVKPDKKNFYCWDDGMKYGGHLENRGEYEYRHKYECSFCHKIKPCYKILDY